MLPQQGQVSLGQAAQSSVKHILSTSTASLSLVLWVNCWVVGRAAWSCDADKGSRSPEQHFASSLCPGRTSFYEQYGVIRDVLQNHLTEALMFLIMELPANVSSAQEVLQHKLQALQSLWGLDRSSAVLGQYQAYDSQVQEELQEARGYVSTTPTFAGESLGWARGAARAEESRRCESLHAIPGPWICAGSGMCPGIR